LPALDVDSGQYHFSAYLLLTRRGRGMKLTKRSIDAIKQNGTDRVLWDDELQGFGLRVKPSGLKSFLIQFRNRQGRSRRLTVGQYGRLTPEEAAAKPGAFLATSKGALIPSSAGLRRGTRSPSVSCAGNT
jgi:hypothetical protein